MEPLVWAILLLLLGFGMILLDVFIPSGAVLSILGLVAIVAAIVVGFSSDLLLGTALLVTSTILLPLIAMLAIRFWPQTPIGRWILLHPARPNGQPEDDALKNLIGKRGRSKTKMLPSGAIVIDGRRYDAVSCGMPIDAGQPVQVVALRMRRLVVRPAAEAPPAQAAEPQELLSRPIDTLGGDPFEDDLLA